jgi:hypothetical protein
VSSIVSRLRSSVRCAERSLTVAARIRAARVSKRVLAKRTIQMVLTLVRFLSIPIVAAAVLSPLDAAESPDVVAFTALALLHTW